jgi:glycerol-3-phosphate dehydrogenase
MIKSPTYKFYQYNRQRADGSTNVRIVAVSSFAGKPVKGYADLHPHDEFDVEYGKALAAARCAEKIAAKRCKRAYNKVDEATAQVNAAMAHLQKMMQYEADAEAAYNIAAYNAAQILSEKACHCGENCECECHCHD